MSCNRNKCYEQEYNGGSCEKCMEDAPYEYCCKFECGEHEFCRGCQKIDIDKWGACPLCAREDEIERFFEEARGIGKQE